MIFEIPILVPCFFLRIEMRETNFFESLVIEGRANGHKALWQREFLLRITNFLLKKYW